MEITRSFYLGRSSGRFGPVLSLDTITTFVQAYSFYSSANYWGLIRPTLAKAMPIPQRYYVPNRIRESYKPRLEAAGLWPAEAEVSSEEPKLGASLLGKFSSAKDPKEIVKSAFALELVLLETPFILRNTC